MPDLAPLLRWLDAGLSGDSLLAVLALGACALAVAALAVAVRARQSLAQAHTQEQEARARHRVALARIEGECAAVVSTQHLDLAARNALLEEHPRLGPFIWSVRDDRLEVSPQWAALGIGGAEGPPATLQALRLLLHPADLDRFDEAIAAHLKGSPRLDVDARVRSKGGEWHWLHFIARVVAPASDGGLPECLVGSFFDEHALKAAEETLALERRLFDTGPVIVLSVDTEPPQRLRSVSASATAALGLPRGSPLVGRPLQELLEPADVAALQAAIATLAGQPGAGFQCEVRLRRADGSARWHSLHALATGAEGRHLRAYLIDVERLKQAEHEAAAQAVHLQAVVDRTLQTQRAAESLRELSELIQCSASTAEACQLVAERGELLLPGWRGTLLLRNPTAQLEPAAHWGGGATQTAPLAPQDCWALRRGQRHASRGPGSTAACTHFGDEDIEHAYCLPLPGLSAGAGLLVLARDTALPDDEGRHAERIAGSFAEAVRLSLSNLQLRLSLEEQASRDWLTGLYNRRYLDERLPREISRALRVGENLAFAILDIDHFKSFNDRYGHEAGDEVIRHVARQLLEFGRDYDLRCRIGGEELGLVMPRSSVEDACQRLEELRTRIARGVVRHGATDLPPVTVSIGVAQADQEGAELLMRRADLALYAAKHGGRNRIETWRPALEARVDKPTDRLPQ
ncbi:MAG TPA: diguanylate cyclase [Methylibium sp.]|nr:diguanylate cyclase [Methylibium sp.]